MTSANTLAAIGVLLALCVAGAIAAIAAGGTGAATSAVPRWELPGGFDPLPEFDSTSRELEFRGVVCGPVAKSRYVLARDCSSDAREQDAMPQRSGALP